MRKNLILILSVLISSCIELELSNSIGISTQVMISSKRRAYMKSDRGKIKSYSLSKNGKVYFLINKNREEDYNWLFLLNRSKSDIYFDCEDGQPKMIQEAKNEEGEWQPIEYWRLSTCGFSHGTCELKSKEYAYYRINKYKGDFKTKMRVKILFKEEIAYSPEFKGMINLSQFEIREELRKDQLLMK